MTLLLLAALASAQEGPDVTDGVHIWSQQRLAASGWPAGAILDSRVQIRAPLHRSDSPVFQDTYAGAGARLAATPAFALAGPRLSIAPIDVFDLEVQAAYIRYYGGEGTGLLEFPEPAHKLQSERSDTPSVQADALQVSASPTVKIKVGPIIAFDAWTFAFTSIAPNKTHSEDLVYEPFTDLVVAWNDVTFEHQGAVIYEVVPDEGAFFFWAGATARDRMALNSKDRSTTVGLVLRSRPAKGVFAPTLTGQMLFHVTDADRVGTFPGLAIVADWYFLKAL